MSQNSTSHNKGQGTTMPITSQSPATTQKHEKSNIIIPLDTEEIHRLPSLDEALERIEQGKILAEEYDKFKIRYKELINFERLAKQESGLQIIAILPNKTKFEFNHYNSNLDFVFEQIEKGADYLINLESKIRNLKLS